MSACLPLTLPITMRSLTQRGEVANRILSVGSSQRAELLSALLEPPAPGQPCMRHLSSRGFLTITGEGMHGGNAEAGAGPCVRRAMCPHAANAGGKSNEEFSLTHPVPSTAMHPN